MAQPQNRNNNAVNDGRRTATMAGRNVTGTQRPEFQITYIYKNRYSATAHGQS
jgi:hypothetical protein